MKDSSASRPARTSVNSPYFVQTKERKTARNGNAYLDLTLLNSKGLMRAKLWDSDSYHADFEEEDVVRVVGDIEEFQGTAQIRVRQITRLPAHEINYTELFPRSARIPEEMLAELIARARQLAEGPLRTLLLGLLEDPDIAAKYKLAPAAMSYHHAYLGGLIEHVLSLIGLADKICDHYTDLRRDLIVAGLVLHDIGKIEELSYKTGIRYTTRGQLIGHISIGAEMVSEKIRAIPDFPATLKDQLLHIILSHHGELQFGSPKEPLFPEALVVHHLDNLDSKLQSMRTQYATDKDRPGEFTARNPALKRELFKIE
jgi:3'-5' exoribonuclease